MPGQPPSTTQKNDSKDSESADPSKDGNKAEEETEMTKFSPEEEAELVAESNALKTEANALFNSGVHADALARYADALAACPTYLAFELAVLHSNVSAVHLKLEDWKEAIASATRALDSLARDLSEREKEEAEREETRADGDGGDEGEEGAGVEDEIVSAGAARAAPAPPNEGEEEDERAARARRRDADVARIRYKALMRRARARSEAGGWSDLAGAEEDYKALAAMDNVGPGDRRIIAAQLRALPPRVKAAQERETAEMWGKLKDLGNGILKPFGLSTENFQMQQDPKTGGYSMNFKS